MSPTTPSRHVVSFLSLALLSWSVLFAAKPAMAQLTVTVAEINPTRSSSDAQDPNAASGGRVNGLAVSPTTNQTFYAASEYGGLFKSTNGGQNWSRLDGHVPTVTWDVEVDPSDANRVYATSFYDGRLNSLAGINVSTDGGVTWIHPATATPPAGFCADAARRDEPSAFGISIDPANPRNVYIGTNCGLAVSRNGGLTWNFIDPTPADGADDVWDVVVHHGGIIDLCGDDGHQRSTDNGVTWTTSPNVPRPGNGRCSIAVSPDESYVLFVVAGVTIYESDDGGTNWSTFANPAAQGRIPFVATNNRAGTAFDLWFGDVTLYRAACTTPTPPTQGGATRCPASNNWVNSQAGAHADAGDLAFNSQAASDACPMVYSNDGGVYVNTLGTSPGCHAPAWEQPAATPRALWLYDLAGADQAGATNEDVYFGNQDTGDFGATNAPVTTPTWNNRDCCDVFDVSADSSRIVNTLCCYGGGRFNRVFVRSPGLTGGAELNNYPTGNVPSFRSMDSIDNFGPSDYVMITTDGVFITRNIAATPAVAWTELGNATSPANACGIQAAGTGDNAVFFVKSGGCDAHRAGSLWRYNGTATGGNWQRINRGGNSAFGVFAVDPGNPNRILASDLAPATGPQMVLSNDGGTNWQALPELDILMTGGGAFPYQNRRGFRGGVNFDGYSQPYLVAFDPVDPNILVAAAVDAGVFVSIDGGTQWHLVSNPYNPGCGSRPHIPRAHHAYFDHEPSNSNVRVYLGTKGRGAWRVSFDVPLPDLVVESLTHRPSAPTTSDQITFTATVKNVGQRPSTNSTLSFRVGGETAPGRTFAVPALAIGSTFTATRRETLTVPRNYTNTAVIDVNSQVLESSETNNQRTDSYTVVRPPQVRCRTSADCGAGKTCCEPGDPASYCVTPPQVCR